MMRAAILAPVLLLTAFLAWAQQQPGASSTPAQTSSSPGASGTAAKRPKPDVLKSDQYSEAVATALLSRIADGFTRRNPKLLLSSFDPQHFEGYGLFSDRVQARLGQHDSFRAYFRILDSVPQDTRAAVNVEWQIEQTSATSGRPPARTTGQARFIFERGPAGWRIVDVAPRDLLTGVRGPA